MISFFSASVDWDEQLFSKPLKRLTWTGLVSEVYLIIPINNPMSLYQTEHMINARDTNH